MASGRQEPAHEQRAIPSDGGTSTLVSSSHQSRLALLQLSVASNGDPIAQVSTAIPSFLSVTEHPQCSDVVRVDGGWRAGLGEERYITTGEGNTRSNTSQLLPYSGCPPPSVRPDDIHLKVCIG